MKRGGKWWGLFASAALVLVFLVGTLGCSSGAPEGTEIRIGITGGQTGPAPADVIAVIEELEHVLNYINEVEGGIDGVPVRWRIIDNGGTPEGAISAYKELRDSFDPLIYFAVEDYYLLGAMADIVADEAVIITASAIQSEGFVPPGRFFGLPIPMADGFAGYVKWVLENHEGPGMPKIGALYWEDVPTGQLWRTAEPWVRKQGVEIELVGYPIRSIDLTPQFLRLRDAEVDYIWMMGVSGNAAAGIAAYHGLEMAGQIPLAFNEYVVADQLLEMVGPGATGLNIYRSEVPYSDGTEAAALYTEIMEWAGEPEGTWSDNLLVMTFKSVLTAAVEKAVDDVGWDNLDSAAIYDALNALTVIDTGGNAVGFGYGPDRRVGVSSIKIARFTADGTVSVSEPIELPRTFEGIDK